MKKIQLQKKLLLQKETISHLQQQHIVGGATVDTCEPVEINTCFCLTIVKSACATAAKTACITRSPMCLEEEM